MGKRLTGRFLARVAELVGRDAPDSDWLPRRRLCRGFRVQREGERMTMTTYQTTLLQWLRWLPLVALVLVGAGYAVGLRHSHTPRNLVAGIRQQSGADDAPHSVDGRPRDTSVGQSVAGLDEEFSRYWNEHGHQPAPVASWEVVSRRLSLALVGSGLSLDEIRFLESLPEESRVEACLENLLRDPRFHDYWAERWARTFVGAEEGPFIVFRRRRFVHWVRDQFRENRPYDAIVRDLVTARGFGNDQPQVNFLTVTLESGEPGQPDPVVLAARTSRAFLGMRIDCLQCHDDFLGNLFFGTASEARPGTQQDFHQLAAFYSGARSTGLQGIRDTQHPYRYEYLDTDQTVEVPEQVPFATDLVPDGSLPRERLAGWLTHPENRPTARAVVNRTWALLFGKPLHQPVDDLPLHGPFPPGLDFLADDLLANHWDLQRLIRVIALCRPFAMDSRDPAGVTEARESAWAVFPVTRLRPEQVAGCVIQASRLKTVDDQTSFLVRLRKFGDSGDFLKRYGDIGEDMFNQDPVTVTQRLLMLNGKFIQEHTGHDPVLNACTHVAMFAHDHAHAIETTYWAVLNRAPSANERERVLQAMETGSRTEVIEDLFWVLFNSSEMAWNH